jgi:hypothetical protein
MGCLYTKLNNSNKYKNLIILDRQDIEKTSMTVFPSSMQSTIINRIEIDEWSFINRSLTNNNMHKCGSTSI